MERRPTRDEIRHLVRDLLREVGAAEGSQAATAREEPAAAGGQGSLSERVRQALAKGAAVEVAMAGERDLNAFAQQVALCALERDLLGAIAANRVRFKLTGTAGPGAAPGVSPGAAPGVSPGAAPGVPPGAALSEAAARGEARAFDWDKGVLNEARIAEIAKTHRRLVLGPKAVLTPLARDRARELRIEIARRKT